MRGFRVGAMAATAAAAIGAALAPGSMNILPPPARALRRQRVEPTYGGGRSRSTPPKGMNGERECARRRRQIAAGSLTEANGLVR